jgi:hypothetical protein
VEEKKTVYTPGTSIAAVVLFFILLFAFSKWGPAIPFSVLSQAKGEPMVVTGNGKATVIPDIARVSAGIEERGTSLKAVQDSVNRKSQTLVAELKKLGIDDDDIKTSSYNVYPQTDYEASPPRVTGYRVSISYQIKVRDIEKINDVITTITPAGANLVGGVSFDLSDEARKAANEEARKDAVAEAKQTAESLARASGVTLGRIINVSENFSGGIPRYATLPMAGGGDASLESKIAEPEIEPGTTEINLTVALSYEVR